MQPTPGCGETALAFPVQRHLLISAYPPPVSAGDFAMRVIRTKGSQYGLPE